MEKAIERGWPLIVLAQAYTKEEIQMDVVNDEEESTEVMEDSEVREYEEGNTVVVENTDSTEPMGEADEGERIEYLVDEMRVEDVEQQNVPETDSSDEEDGVPVSAEWNNRNFRNVTISEGYSVPWEYHENEVTEGAIYKDKDVVQDAVKYWSLSVKRSFVVAKSSKKLYDVKCVFTTCPFRVHAFEQKWSKL